jgi:Flp pilus assembly protein TadG
MRTRARRFRRRLVACARSDRGASAVELAVLAPVLLIITFLIISFAMWFNACHAALAAAQEGDLVAREEAGNPQLQGKWEGDAQTYAMSFYHGLDTNGLVNPTAQAGTATDSGPYQEVTVTVQGTLNWFLHVTIHESVTGPVECFHTAASGGAACG